MNTITNTLAKHGLTMNELPKKILNKIAFLEETLEELEEAKADLKIEEDDEVRQEMASTIEKSGVLIENVTAEIVNDIEALVASKQPPVAPVKPVEPPIANTAPKKKAGALPYIIGGVLLVLTLGAVNVMQEK